MSSDVNDYLKTLKECDGLGEFAIGNFDIIEEFEVKDKLALMQQLQTTLSRLTFLEKRMRAELVTNYDCNLGKSKTHNEAVMGFKIATKRPQDDKVVQDEMTRIRSELGEERFEDLFKATYSVVNKELKEANHDEIAIVKTGLITKDGSLSLKVTKLGS